jgi:hypothetical protein
MTRLGEFIVWSILAICPDHDLKFTDLDGVRFHAYAWEEPQGRYSIRGLNIRYLSSSGSVEVQHAVVYYLDNWTPIKGYERYEGIYDSHGRLVVGIE